MQFKTATSIVLMATLMSLQAQAAPVAQDTNSVGIANPAPQSLATSLSSTPHIQDWKKPQTWDTNEADLNIPADLNIQADPNATDEDENAKWGGGGGHWPWWNGGWGNNWWGNNWWSRPWSWNCWW
ncbi:hypothetical protein BGZ96_009666 [Linnemannia gamsii]|uniref:Secreted protein n=1 Tax=Linnemannia gamsii TaxID=64522 RepID=A0ABQ7JXR0_9FUNG|nr:hypothetical protein BGZ96_009666 [Linnemannia gamsii]